MGNCIDCGEPLTKGEAEGLSNLCYDCESRAIDEESMAEAVEEL